MTRKRQTRRVEIPDPIPESSGRNLRGYGVGASNVTARIEDGCHGCDGMMEAVVERENMMSAYKCGVSNKGSAGVDGMTVNELKPFLQMHWAQIKEQLLSGRYEPQPVLRVEIRTESLQSSISLLFSLKLKPGQRLAGFLSPQGCSLI